MKQPKFAAALVVFFALLAVIMAVVTVKISPLDQSNAAFVVEEPYVRASLPTSPTAAGFFVLRNQTGRDDLLIGVRADWAEGAKLHRHAEDANGVMRMSEITQGVPLADGQSHAFARAGDHLMFTGLNGPLEQGALRQVTLLFETAGEVEITLPVDHDR